MKCGAEVWHACLFVYSISNTSQLDDSVSNTLGNTLVSHLSIWVNQVTSNNHYDYHFPCIVSNANRSPKKLLEVAGNTFYFLLLLFTCCIVILYTA